MKQLCNPRKFHHSMKLTLNFLGNQTQGSLCNNFTDFCALNGLVIGGSIFAPKRKNKVTWASPDNSTENQIGHICINKKFRRFLQDVRARRGAGVASDHHLVITRVKLKLKRNSSVTTRRQRYNVSLLRENENEQRTRTDFTISSKFNDLELEGEGDIPGMKHKWRNVKEVLNFTCEEVVGFRKHQHKEGICISRDITVVISPTRPSTIFSISKTTFWWTSIKCIRDNNGVKFSEYPSCSFIFT